MKITDSKRIHALKKLYEAIIQDYQKRCEYLKKHGSERRAEDLIERAFEIRTLLNILHDDNQLIEALKHYDVDLD